MTAKDYLSKIKLYDKRITQDIAELDALRNKATGVTGVRYDKEKVKSSPTADQLINDVDAIIKMEKHINSEIDNYYDIKQHIIEQIRNIGNDIYEEILYIRYVDLSIEGRKVREKTLEEIAVMMGYSYDRVKHLHIQALNYFADVYKFDRMSEEEMKNFENPTC